ncbi:hypothetical protein ACOMHN_055681 [Nucella lapillus]
MMEYKKRLTDTGDRKSASEGPRPVLCCPGRAEMDIGASDQRIQRWELEGLGAMTRLLPDWMKVKWDVVEKEMSAALGVLMFKTYSLLSLLRTSCLRQRRLGRASENGVGDHQMEHFSHWEIASVSGEIRHFAFTEYFPFRPDLLVN